MACMQLSSQAFVRVDMLRKGATYEVLLSRHRLSSVENGHRPAIETEILFRGIHGRLELDLRGEDKTQAGRVAPAFYSLAGEAVPIPDRFLPVMRAATKAVNCRGCSHTHYLRKPVSRPMNASGSFATDSAVGGASLVATQSSEV